MTRTRQRKQREQQLKKQQQGKVYAIARAPDAFRSEGVSPEAASQVAINTDDLRASPDISTMWAEEFTFDEAVFSFGLTFPDPVPGLNKMWRIQDSPETKNFPSTQGLSKSSKHSHKPI